jgi:hypothetical protein
VHEPKNGGPSTLRMEVSCLHLISPTRLRVSLLTHTWHFRGRESRSHTQKTR